MNSLSPTRRAVLARGALLFSIVAGAGRAPAQTAQPSGYVFSTLAGRSLFGGLDGPGDQASFAQPASVAVDRNGNIYVADTYNQTIRKITPAHGVSTLAGQRSMPGSADGTGSAAQFSFPYGVAIDRNDNVVVADTRNDTIRLVTPDGVVTTLAGQAGVAGSVDGTGSAARFNHPTSVAVDLNGTIYVVDGGNTAIRKISPTGAVTTLAGMAGNGGTTDGVGSAARFSDPFGVAVDGAGNVFVTDPGADTIRRIAADGTVTTFAGSANQAGAADGVGAAARFDLPSGVAADANGNLYVTEFKNGTVRKIAPGGIVTTLAGSANQSGAADGTGSAATFYSPEGDAIDANGNLFVADFGNGLIREVTPTGVVTTIAGQAGSAGSADGTGSAARFDSPNDLVADAAGNLYVTEPLNYTVRKVTPAGVVTTFAGSAGQKGSVDAMGAAARFGFLESIAIDAAGNLYVGDSDNFTIRKIAPDGTVSTFAGQTGSPGWSDGPVGTAQFIEPTGLAFDSAGNLYVADRNGATVRKITPAGVVTTIAGQPGMPGTIDGPASVSRFAAPERVAVDPAGNVLVVDGEFTIRKIAPDGTVSTFSGKSGDRRSVDGPVADARFASANGLAIDPLGNIFVTDGNGTVRRITPAGIVSTIAGVALVPGNADGSDAAVRFNTPGAVTLDHYGNLYVADTGNNTIRQAVSTTRLINLSVRGPVAAGDQTLIMGYVITGPGPKPVLVRAVGPGLTAMGIASPIADPEFKIYDRNAQAILANDNWGDGPDLSGVFTRLGAYPLTPGSKDAALYATLAAGPHTTHVGSADGSSGIALTEVYDGDSNVATRLVNASARTVTGGGENVLIAGLVLGGYAPKTVLVRAVGPSLVNQGLSPGSVLADPKLTLYRGSTAIGSNDNWGGTATLKAAFQQVGAFALAADTSKDAALLVTLDPGVYSVVVQGGDLMPGVALIEVYEVP